MKKKSSEFQHFTRGGQTTLHGIHMFWQVLKYGILIAIFLLAAVFYWRFTMSITDYDAYVFDEYVTAKVKVFLHGNQVKHRVQDPKAQWLELKAIDFIRSQNTRLHVKNYLTAFWTALWQAGITSLSFLGLFIGFCRWRGKMQQETEYLAGQDEVEAKELSKLLKRKGRNSDFNLAGVPLVKGTETQHILLAGTTGSGKTVAIRELMDQVRQKGQRAVVYDIDGSFVPLYYRPGKDILLNPLDERAPVWNIWQECSDLADFDTIASSLMPEHLAVNDPFWIRSAHTIFSCAALRLQQEKNPTTKALLDPMFGDGLQPLADLVAGTPAAPLVSSKIEKTALSIQATLSTYCKSLIYLKKEGKHPLFSIKRWIEAPQNDSWLFN